MGAKGVAVGRDGGGRGGEDKGVMDHGDVIGREREIADKLVASGMAVGDDVGGVAQAAAEKPREGFTGAHSADDGGAGEGAGEGGPVAVGHAAHGEHDVGGEGAGGAGEAGGEPIEAEVAGLQGNDIERRGFAGEGAAGAEGEETHGVADGGETVGEEQSLAFGAAATQVVLDEEDFHGLERCERKGERSCSIIR